MTLLNRQKRDTGSIQTDLTLACDQVVTEILTAAHAAQSKQDAACERNHEFRTWLKETLAARLEPLRQKCRVLNENLAAQAAQQEQAAHDYTTRQEERPSLRAALSDAKEQKQTLESQILQGLGTGVGWMALAGVGMGIDSLFTGSQLLQIQGEGGLRAIATSYLTGAGASLMLMGATELAFHERSLLESDVRYWSTVVAGWTLMVAQSVSLACLRKDAMGDGTATDYALFAVSVLSFPAFAMAAAMAVKRALPHFTEAFRLYGTEYEEATRRYRCQKQALAEIDAREKHARQETRRCIRLAEQLDGFLRKVRAQVRRDPLIRAQIRARTREQAQDAYALGNL